MTEYTTEELIEALEHMDKLEEIFGESCVDDDFRQEIIFELNRREDTGREKND